MSPPRLSIFPFHGLPCLVMLQQHCIIYLCYILCFQHHCYLLLWTIDMILSACMLQQQHDLFITLLVELFSHHGLDFEYLTSLQLRLFLFIYLFNAFNSIVLLYQLCYLLSTASTISKLTIYYILCSCTCKHLDAIVNASAVNFNLEGSNFDCHQDMTLAVVLDSFATHGCM